jgi:hypothetical protein
VVYPSEIGFQKIIMNDSRQRNSQGQFAPEQQGGMDANTTSAAYNPQIIEARKASLAEKLRRAIGIRRGVEESVPQEQRVLSRGDIKLRLRELATQVAPPYVEEKKRGGIAKVGALGLGLGLGIGGAVAGVRYLRPVVSKAANRAARNVTKGAQDVADAAKSAIPEAAEAVKKTAADAQDAMALGSDLGKAYKWAKSAVGGGLYNIRHPRQTMRETRGAFRAGVKEGQLRRAAKLAGKSKEEIDAIKVPYPRRARPDWALSAVLRLVEFSDALLKKYDPEKKENDPWGGRFATAAGAMGLGIGGSQLLVSRIKPTIYGKGDKGGVDANRRSDVLDRFARSKGYSVVGPKFAGQGQRVHAAVMPGTVGLKSKKGDAFFRDVVAQMAGAAPGEKGVLFRPKKSPDFVRAHEVGHILQKPTLIKSLPRLAGNYAPLAAVGGLIGTERENDKKAAIIAGAGTAMALPTLVNEVDASARGYKVMRKLGASRMRAAGAFVGLPTYGAMAAIPALAWGGRKLRQKIQEKKERK